MTTTEPAIKSYFFEKGYTDLWDTIQESWRLNWVSATQAFRDGKLAGVPGGASALFVSAFHYARGISVVLFGTTFFVALSAVHITILITVFSIVYTLALMVWISERAYLFVKGFVTVCPSCHERHPLPEYLCTCGRVHPRLIPSSYGILHHTCRCGASLPATFFLDRGALPSQCPNANCHHQLSREHTETKKLHVAIVGAPSVGKSAYLFAAVREILDQHAAKMGATCQFVDQATRSQFDRVRSQLSAGDPPDKTLDTLPRAFNLSVEKASDKRLCYFYDAAGEAFQDVEILRQHQYQAYLTGVVLLIDPFAIDQVREGFDGVQPAVWAQLRPSGQPPQETLDRLLVVLEQEYHLRKDAPFKAPVAVVLNKVDALGLEEIVGERAVDRELKARMRKAGTATPDPAAVRDEVIRKQLEDWGQRAFLQVLDARFSNVRFFTCSALGHMADGSRVAFSPVRVLTPLLWIARTADDRFGWLP